VLKVLEQEGWMGFNEQVFVPVKAQFTCTKETLYRFETSNQELEPLIKMLLRSYEGIFDMPVAIFEKQLAGWLKIDLPAVQQALRSLHQHGIIRYEPQKDQPQLYLLRERVRAEDLTINPVNYKKRKDQFEKRIDDFTRFTVNTDDCRSVMIGRYFGDDSIQPCGICDNCLQKRKKQLTAEEFSAVCDRIEKILQAGPVKPADLLPQLKNVSKEKAWSVIDFLQAEKKIVLNADGLFCKINS